MFIKSPSVHSGFVYDFCNGNGFKITQEYKGKLNYSESFLLYVILWLDYKDYNIKIGEFKEL